MTRRRDLEHQLSVLGEIKGILGAMKNLATLEIRKLSRMRASQNRVLETIATAAEDFLVSYHVNLEPPSRSAPLVLLAGSERGFCGNFNGMLIEQAEAQVDDLLGERARLVAVGNKLASRLEGNPRVVARLPGPSVAEEVVPALIEVLRALAELRAPEGPFADAPVWIAYHEPESGEVLIEELTAIVKPAGAPEHTTPVCIQLEPPVLLRELIEQHLFASVTRAVYASLTAENRFRLAHMDTATRRIETRLEEIGLRRNILRQEEITQEMELILLTAGALEPRPE